LRGLWYKLGSNNKVKNVFKLGRKSAGLNSIELLNVGGELMENKEIKITIDPNGNIQRKVIDKPLSEVQKPKLIKRIVSTLATTK
jgi:hypothetical protein